MDNPTQHVETLAVHAGRRHDDPARSLNWLGDERTDPLGTDPLDRRGIGVSRKNGQSVGRHGRHSLLKFGAASATCSLKPEEGAQDRRCLTHPCSAEMRWLIENDPPEGGRIVTGRIGPEFGQEPGGDEDIGIDLSLIHISEPTRPY